MLLILNPLVTTLLRSQSPILIHQPSSLSLELMSIGYCQSVYSMVSGKHLTILTNPFMKQSLPLGFRIRGFLHSLPSSMVTASKTLFPPPLPLSTFTPPFTCSISILLTAIVLQTKNSKVSTASTTSTPELWLHWPKIKGFPGIPGRESLRQTGRSWLPQTTGSHPDMETQVSYRCFILISSMFHLLLVFLTSGNSTTC